MGFGNRCIIERGDDREINGIKGNVEREREKIGCGDVEGRVLKRGDKIAAARRGVKIGSVAVCLFRKQEKLEDACSFL